MLMTDKRPKTSPAHAFRESRPASVGVTALRVLTFNTGLQALPLGRRRKVPLAKYSAQRLAAIPDRLRAIGADIIALQEVYHASDRARIAAALARDYPYCFAASARWSLIGNGLMLLSRYPILSGKFSLYDSTPLSLRLLWEQGFLAADIQIGGLEPITVFNIHLSAGKPFGDFESPNTRERRAWEISQLLAATNGGNVILAGDFNTSPDVCGENYHQILAAGYADAHAELHGNSDGAVTWDSDNPYNHAGVHSHEPSQRVDHIFLPANGRYIARQTDVVLREPLFPWDGDGFTLSDHFGMLALFEISSSS
jgi:endonuclease/exonuclease/phosphatase family metal-dependent hydrolase